MEWKLSQTHKICENKTAAKYITQIQYCLGQNMSCESQTGYERLCTVFEIVTI